MGKAWLLWDPKLMIRLRTSHGTWNTCGTHLDHWVGNHERALKCLAVPLLAFADWLVLERVL